MIASIGSKTHMFDTDVLFHLQHFFYPAEKGLTAVIPSEARDSLLLHHICLSHNMIQKHPEIL
jgi:hypothetical protein